MNIKIKKLNIYFKNSWMKSIFQVRNYFNLYMKNERKIKNESDRNTTQCAEYSKRASYDTE